MLYSKGKLFDGYKNFFKYQPNLSKRNLHFYYKENEFLKIWDYEFSTNNFGLVQKSDIYSDKDSILFLGDSFTEGQGATPWIDNFEGIISSYQVINGGIIGTGFQQFENIYDHISENFRINKVVIIYIGGDLRRGISIASDENILFIPDDEKQLDNFLSEQQKLRSKRKEKIKERLRFIIRDMYLYNILRSQINTFRLKNDLTIKKNFESIHSLVKKNNDNIIFINIKTANEIITGQESYETKLLNNFFIKHNYPSYKCDLSDDISNFHEIDYHPNKKGYNEIFNCVKEIIYGELIKS